MTTAIVKFNKSNLSKVSSKDLFLENSWGLTITQFYDAIFPYSHSFPFEISVAKEHAPHIKEEMVLVIREKVDLTAQGPNDTIIKNIGKDLGGEEVIDNKPHRPKDLPPGFQEVLRL